MNTKMIKCKTCDEEIASNAKICPKCGAKNKKPIYKKLWFWAFIILVILIVAVSSGGDDTSGSSSSIDNSSSVTSDKNSSNTLNAVEAYESIAENGEPTFTIPDKAIEFINQHKDFFPGKSEIKGAISDYVNEEVTYAHLSKSITKYSDKLVSVYGYVIDIQESEDGSLTYLHIVDYDDNNYTLYYLGALDDILKGTEVHGYALPFAMTTFENLSAQYTESVTGAACYIEKLY